MQPPQQQKLPHWLACCANRAVLIWTVNMPGAAEPIEGFFAHASDGFLELVTRRGKPGEFAIWEYRQTFIHIQHICRIEPCMEQWAPVKLDKVERPKLVI